MLCHQICVSCTVSALHTYKSDLSVSMFLGDLLPVLSRQNWIIGKQDEQSKVLTRDIRKITPRYLSSCGTTDSMFAASADPPLIATSTDPMIATEGSEEAVKYYTEEYSNVLHGLSYSPQRLYL